MASTNVMDEAAFMHPTLPKSHFEDAFSTHLRPLRNQNSKAYPVHVSKRKLDAPSFVLQETIEVPCQAVEPAPGQAEAASSINSSKEDERDMVSACVSEVQSFPVKRLKQSDASAGSESLNGPGDVLPMSCLDSPLPAAPITELSQKGASFLSDSSFSRSLVERLADVRERLRPNQLKSGHPVSERPFLIADLLRIKKNEYEAYREPLDATILAKWHGGIHRKLQKDVEAVIHGTSLNQNEMTVSVSLSMVGPRIGDVLHLQPTIVISCAHKRVKSRIEELVGSDQLDYLRELVCRCVVRVQGRGPKRRDRFLAKEDSTEAVDSAEIVDCHKTGLSVQLSWEIDFEQPEAINSVCGSKIKFTYSTRESRLGEHGEVELEQQHRMTARIGGVIYIGIKAFALTTSHTFLLHTLRREYEVESGIDSTSDTVSDPNLDNEAVYDSNEINSVSSSDSEAKLTNEDVFESKEIESEIETSIWVQSLPEFDVSNICWAFSNVGARPDLAESVELQSTNSDWCILPADKLDTIFNYYQAQNEKGQMVDTTVDQMATEEIVEAGNVYVIEQPDKPILAYLTQTTTSIHFGGTSLTVRRLVSRHSLAPGISGCWVVRGRQLLGHVVAGNSFEKTMYMVCVQDTRQAIEELTGRPVSIVRPMLQRNDSVEDTGFAVSTFYSGMNPPPTRTKGIPPRPFAIHQPHNRETGTDDRFLPISVDPAARCFGVWDMEAGDRAQEGRKDPANHGWFQAQRKSITNDHDDGEKISEIIVQGKVRVPRNIMSREQSKHIKLPSTSSKEISSPIGPGTLDLTVHGEPIARQNRALRSDDPLTTGSSYMSPQVPVNHQGGAFQTPSRVSPSYLRASYPTFHSADQNPPCNTLYVGNLPIDVTENELKAMFSKQRGYKRLCFRTKQNGPMCFVEFEDVSFATDTLQELNGAQLSNSIKGGIRLSFSKNPLGGRAGQPGTTTDGTQSRPAVLWHPPMALPTPPGFSTLDLPNLQQPGPSEWEIPTSPGTAFGGASLDPAVRPTYPNYTVGH